MVINYLIERGITRRMILGHILGVNEIHADGKLVNERSLPRMSKGLLGDIPGFLFTGR